MAGPVVARGREVGPVRGAVRRDRARRCEPRCPGGHGMSRVATGEASARSARRTSGASGAARGGQGVLIAGLVALAFATFALDRALVAACLAAVLVVLAAIDIREGIIPNRIVLPASGLIALLQIALFPD